MSSWELSKSEEEKEERPHTPAEDGAEAQTGEAGRQGSTDQSDTGEAWFPAPQPHAQVGAGCSAGNAGERRVPSGVRGTAFLAQEVGLSSTLRSDGAPRSPPLGCGAGVCVWKCPLYVQRRNQVSRDRHGCGVAPRAASPFSRGSSVLTRGRGWGVTVGCHSWTSPQGVAGLASRGTAGPDVPTFRCQLSLGHLLGAPSSGGCRGSPLAPGGDCCR